MAAGDILLDDAGNEKLDTAGNVLLDDGNGNNCPCGCGGKMCYPSKRCDDDTNAGIQVWSEIVAALPFYFFVPPDITTRYYIPADAVAAACVGEPNVNIFRVFDCPPEPQCCRFVGNPLYTGHNGVHCCYHTTHFVRLAMDVDEPTNPYTGEMAGAYTAWNAMKDGDFPYLVGGTGGPCAQEIIDPWESFNVTHGRISSTWIHSGTTYRLFAYTRSNGFHLAGRAAATVQKWNPDLAVPAWVFHANLWVATLAPASPETFVHTCCHAKLNGYWDGEGGFNTFTLDINFHGNKCCTDKDQRPWDPDTTYSEGDTVEGCWRSLQNGNLNHEPPASDPPEADDWWTPIECCEETDGSDNCPDELDCPDLDAP